MVSTYSPNIQLEEPARGDQVGTWDTPVNNNMTLIDLVLGGRTSILLNNSPVVLASAQFQCKTITFSSTLTGNVSITFPTSFTKSYEILNLCTGSSAFVITLQTTVAGGQAICCPPGEIFECLNDGSNIKYKNFGRVGEFLDFVGSSVPAWVTGCTVPPYLNCDGTSFSSATYPVLTTIRGGSNSVPDLRGVVRATLNQGTGRMNSSLGGVNGNATYTTGGADSITLTAGQIPANIPYTDPGHFHSYGPPNITSQYNNGTNTPAWNSGVTNSLNTTTNVTGITINPSGGSFHSNMQPTTVVGITMIRAA